MSALELIFGHNAGYIQGGGWLMVPLALVSLVMWTLILERFYAFFTLTYKDMDGNEAILALQGAPISANAHGLHVQLIRQFLLRRRNMPNLDNYILREISRHLTGQLSRSLAFIAVLASVAPLLGLLGTVLGMIRTFDAITTFGTGNARALAAGISLALITTQVGLFVTIPGVLFLRLLRNRARQIGIRLAETTTILERHIQSGKPRMQAGAHD